MIETTCPSVQLVGILKSGVQMMKGHREFEKDEIKKNSKSRTKRIKEIRSNSSKEAIKEEKQYDKDEKLSNQ